eukprot:TRINITY_DN9492_c0_g1_i4.p1 TRINITY_DN9492_c0_g1~~TRINITY_DN9492_c0_g1_i4.p1  ORF type:complete len:517 (+),score=64.99 TRINITY_DN9492_c0_g1_i4:36-1586(+)
MEQNWNLTFEETNLEAEFLADRKGRLLTGHRRSALLVFSGLSLGWIIWLASGFSFYHPAQVYVLALSQALSFFWILFTWRAECNGAFCGNVLEYLAITGALVFQVGAVFNDMYYIQRLEGIDTPVGYYSDTRLLMMLIMTLIALRLLVPVRWSRLLLGDVLCNLVYATCVLALGSPEGLPLGLLNIMMLALATCGLVLGHRQIEQSERLRFVDIVEADATLLKQNSELRQRSQLASTLLGSLCEATVVVQQNFDIISASASFARMMATPKEDIVGRNFLGYVHSAADRICLEHAVTGTTLGPRFERNDGFDDSCSSGVTHVVLKDALSQTYSMDLHFAVLGEAEPMILGIKESSERRSSTVSPDQAGELAGIPSRKSNQRGGNATKERDLEAGMIQVDCPALTIIGKSSASASQSCTSEPLCPVPDRPKESPQAIDGLWTAEENSPVNAPRTIRIICGRAWVDKSSMKLTLCEDGKYRTSANDKSHFALDEMGLLHRVSGNGQAVLYRRTVPSISD